LQRSCRARSGAGAGALPKPSNGHQSPDSQNTLTNEESASAAADFSQTEDERPTDLTESPLPGPIGWPGFVPPALTTTGPAEAANLAGENEEDEQKVPYLPPGIAGPVGLPGSAIPPPLAATGATGPAGP
jgi:hypothetical protein